MVKQLYSENLSKLTHNKRLIEKTLKIKLDINKESHIITIEGNAESEIIAINLIEAINLGFSVDDALELKRDEFVFEKIPIKMIATRKNLSQVRARIIGTQRKALDTIEALSNCVIFLHDNTVGIIGRFDDVKNAKEALSMIIAGSRHASAFAFLERQNAIVKLGDVAFKLKKGKVL